MRIKNGDYITEVKEVIIRKDDIDINGQFIQTKEDTDKIAKQLLEKGYADLTKYEIWGRR